MTSHTKIIIVDDHFLFREGIKFLIEEENLGKIIAEAENGQEFLNMLEKQNPDLVLMDIEMPLMDGMEATRQALAMRPGLKILGLTMFFEREYLNAMILSGAMGFVLKTSGKNELEKAIRTVLRGETYFPNLKVMH
jgi:DNA-binding NarL/FixJ family response regulator